MEFRKEKSAKSKELIKIHSKSNIFNIDTGYYKTEKIYPISPKPTEIGPKLSLYDNISPFTMHPELKKCNSKLSLI